jgi:hypothetical protein
MTQRTKAAMATQISTLLADNTAGDISASDVRSVHTDTVDSLVGGPASATDNAVARFDATTGQLVQNSAVIIDDSNNVSGVGTLGCGALTVTAGEATFNAGAGDFDFTVNKDTAGSAIVYDAGADTLALNSTLTTHTGALTVEGAVIFNDTSADVDFRVESNGNANAIFVDAGNDRVGIMNGAPAVTLDVTGAVTASTAVTAGTFLVTSVGDALTAAGTTRADALALTAQINNVTTAASGTGVILPAAVVGQIVIIENAGANLIQVYGAGSDTIDGVAATTGVPLTNAKRCMYICVAAATYISAQLGVVST